MSEVSPETGPVASSPELADVIENSLEQAVGRLERSRDFAKPAATPQVLELCRRLMMQPGGIERLYLWAPRLDRAGVFLGTDWQDPKTLLASLVANTLELGDRQTLVIECLSQLRALSVADGSYVRTGFSAEQAHHFLSQVLAHNLSKVFSAGVSEAERQSQPDMTQVVNDLLHFLVEHVGYEDILGNLTDEIWRILGQRPIQVGHVKAMITQIAITLARGDYSLGDARLGADRLISALFGPTKTSLDDLGIPHYRAYLAAMDFNALQQEARGFARAMHDVGLVSDYHAAFLRWLLENERVELIPDALGLSNTGLDSLQCYSKLVYQLIEEAIYPETAQAVYGLAMLLERGVLFIPPIGPGLWRQISLDLSENANATISAAFGQALPARVFLLAGTISVLGQPLGLGQGNNPTCQSVRAISMWSFNAPDYLLHLIDQVGHFDGMLMHFEGAPINSAELPVDLTRAVPIDSDPVSNLLVPHLDRIYLQMGRLCADRGEDPHRWINPEFHGWWVGRGFNIAVDVATGKLHDYDGFLRNFFACYHPLNNGNQLVIHPQPAGLAVTDSSARFVGWHAITILRVALDQSGEMRVYFYNPNNDSGQNWGNGIKVSTQDNGERYGESSLPFNQLASRLYIFHDDPLTSNAVWGVAEEELQNVKEMAFASWAADRIA